MTYDPHSLAILAGCAPLLQIKVKAAMDYLAPFGVFFRVAQGLRDATPQTALYAQGRTSPGRIVTNARAGYSNHNFGMAVDCYPFLKGSTGALELNDPTVPVFQQMVHGVSLQGLAWGGLWSHPKDCPHFQLANVPVTPLDSDRALLASGGLHAVWAHYNAL